MVQRLVLSAIFLALASAAPAQSQQSSPPDSLDGAAVDSMREAFSQFDRAGLPTAADSARLRRWADSVQAIGDSHVRSNPSRALGYLRPVRRAYRELADSSGVADVTLKLGNTYENQGRYEEALPRLRSALSILREIEDREGVAEALNKIGIVYWRQGRYEETLARFRESLSIRRDIGDRKGVAITLNNVGVLHKNQGRYEEALAGYREALTVAREIGYRRVVASALGNMGVIHARQGRYEKALSHHERSLQAERQVGDQNGIASSLINVGFIHESQGRYEKALPRYREALGLYRETGNREGVANALENIGSIYKSWGQYEKALAHYRESLAMRREMGARPGIAQVLSSIGEIRRRQGQSEKALGHYREALQINRDLGDRLQIAKALNSLGDLYRQQGRSKEARARYREALSLNRELDRRLGVARNLQNIGTLSLRDGRLRAATDTLRRAVRLAETLRTEATSPEARRSLLSMQIGAYQTLTAAHVRSRRPDSALRSVEKARARLLADRLAGTATGDTTFSLASAKELRRALGPEEAALLYAGTGAEWPLTALVVTEDTTTAHELPDSRIRVALKREYPTQLKRLRREDGSLTAAIGELASREQGAPPSLAETIRLYRYYLTRGRADTSVQKDLSRRLHALLIEPIADAVADKSKLIAVPTGSLGYLPIETLRDSTGQYLVQDKRIRYAQSLTVLRQLQGRDYPAPERSLLALGGAAYEPNPEIGSGMLVAEAWRGSTRVATEEQASTLLRDANRRMENGKSPHRIYQQLGYARWTDLPGTKSEVAQLGAVAGEKATVLTGEEASEDTVRAISERSQLSGYRRVHFATHGVAIPESPELSALVLSQTNASDSLAARDGYLTMEEIASLDMRADVAVLSACQTGLGKVVAGEGVVSLSHAFLRAGANATLVSQWKVLDESTRQFMTAVYKRAKEEDASFAEAVTETKRAFIAGEFGEKNTDPLRWAPFVYYGRE